MQRLKNFKNDETGAVMIIITVGMVVFLSMAALVTDMGLVYYEKSKLQTALDSAALAAVDYMPDQARAREVALEYVRKNGFDSDNVVVEFPTNDKVRVSKEQESQTIFATVFGTDSVDFANVAAAQKINQSAEMDFPYLLFSESDVHLGGKLDIHGNLHTNTGVKISPGSGSRIIGTVTAHSSNSSDFEGPNYLWQNGSSTGPYYYNCWSTYIGDGVGPTDVNGVIPGSPYVEMPDYDDAIMGIVPQFPEVSSWPVPRYAFSDYKKVVTVNSWPDLIFPLCSMHCTGTYSDPWLDTHIYGDFYVDGNCTFGKSVTIYGDLYVKGNLTLQGGSWMYVSGNIYCNGNVTLSGTTTGSYYDRDYDGNGSTDGNSVFIGGNIFCKHDITMGGGAGIIVGYQNYIRYLNNSPQYDTYYIYAGGKVDFGGSVTLTNGVIYAGNTFKTYSGGYGSRIRGVIVAENNIDIGGVPTQINAESDTQGTFSMYSRNGNIVFSPGSSGMQIWGLVYAPNGNINIGSGQLHFNGSIIGKTLFISSGGVDVGKCDRTLPFTTSVFVSALVE